MPDFFGEDTVDPFGNAGAQKPAGYDDPEAVKKRESQRIYANFVRGLDANGNPLPAYGTPQSQGGTATQYTATPIAVGSRDAGLNPQRVVRRDAAGLATDVNVVLAGSNGTPQRPTPDVFRPIAATDPEFMSGAGMAGGAGYAGGRGGANGAQVGGDLATADALGSQVTGAAPTVDPNHQVNQANIDRLTPVIDPALERNAEIDRAFAMSEDLVNRIMNAPSQTGLIADRMLSNQLALGRSAPGGIGAAQGGVKAALGAAPQLQAQATQASIQEQQARAQAATGAAQIYAGVAGSTADRAVRIQEANTQAATNVIGNLTQLTGIDYQFDAAKMQTIGQLARDYFNNAQAFANMDVQMQTAQWEDLTKRYGIDASFKAAIKQISAQENIGPLDAMKLVLGGVTAVGGFAAAGGE